MTETAHQRPILVLGGTGKTGRREVTFAEATATIAEAGERDITYTRIPLGGFADYARATAATGVWSPPGRSAPGSPR